MHEIASKEQKVEPASEMSNQDEAEAIKSNFSTEAQRNQQRVYNSSHLQKYNDLSNKINRFSHFSDTLNKIKNSKTKSVLAGRSQGRNESSSNRSNSSKICSSLDPNDIDGLEQRVSNDLLQLEKMLSKHLNLEKRIGNQMMSMNHVDMARNALHPQQAAAIQGYPAQHFGMLPQQALQSHQLYPPQYQNNMQQHFQYYPGTLQHHFMPPQNQAQMLAQAHGFHGLPHYQTHPHLLQVGPQSPMHMPMQVPQMNQANMNCYQPLGMNQMQQQPVMMSPTSRSFVPTNQNDKYECQFVSLPTAEQQQQRFMPNQGLPPHHQSGFDMASSFKPQSQEHQQAKQFNADYAANAMG